MVLRQRAIHSLVRFILSPWYAFPIQVILPLWLQLVKHWHSTAMCPVFESGWWWSKDTFWKTVGVSWYTSLGCVSHWRAKYFSRATASSHHLSLDVQSTTVGAVNRSTVEHPPFRYSPPRVWLPALVIPSLIRLSGEWEALLSIRNWLDLFSLSLRSFEFDLVAAEQVRSEFSGVLFWFFWSTSTSDFCFWLVIWIWLLMYLGRSSGGVASVFFRIWFGGRWDNFDIYSRHWWVNFAPFELLELVNKFQTTHLISRLPLYRRQAAFESTATAIDLFFLGRLASNFVGLRSLGV